MVRPTLIELAVRVLRAAVKRARGERIDAADVRLALRCLLSQVDDRQLLVEFWTYAGQPHSANRSQSCDAVLQSIVADLRAAGRYPDADQEARRLAAETSIQLAHDREIKRQVQRRHYFSPPPRRR
jgi:hypothetical protein